MFFRGNVFPPYNESQSDAHEWAERWSHSERTESGDRRVVPYHGGWYIIQAFDDMTYGYQIVEKVDPKNVDKEITQ